MSAPSISTWTGTVAPGKQVARNGVIAVVPSAGSTARQRAGPDGRPPSCAAWVAVMAHDRARHRPVRRRRGRTAVGTLRTHEFVHDGCPSSPCRGRRSRKPAYTHLRASPPVRPVADVRAVARCPCDSAGWTLAAGLCHRRRPMNSPGGVPVAASTASKVPLPDLLKCFGWRWPHSERVPVPMGRPPATFAPAGRDSLDKQSFPARGADVGFQAACSGSPVASVAPVGGDGYAGSRAGCSVLRRRATFRPRFADVPWSRPRTSGRCRRRAVPESSPRSRTQRPRRGRFLVVEVDGP